MIAALVLVNWMAFRGRHVIVLGPGAFAITARREADARSSNGVGKSSILEAVDYALTGRLRKERRIDVDGWITRGEQEGSVCLELEGGATILRSKKIGQSRQVRFSRPGYSDASQEGAEKAILDYVCMSAAEFQRGPYVEQQEAARMVHADPAERTRIVGAWLGLSKAEAAEKRAGDIAAAKARATAEEAARRDVQRASIANFAAGPVDEVAEQTRANEMRERASEAMVQLRDARARRDRRVKARAIADKHDAAKKIAKELREKIARGEDECIDLAYEQTQKQYRAALAARDTAKTELAKKKKVALGLFDGACPVAPIECPAKKTINESGAATRKAADAAELEHARLVREAGALFTPAVDAEAAWRELAAARRDLEKVAREIKDGVEAAKSARAELAIPEDDAAAIDEAFEAAHKLIVEADGIERAIKEARVRAEQMLRAESKLEELEASVERLRSEQRAAARTRAVFRTAARRVAEDALGGIEAAANDAIAQAGVELVVRARFEREGKDIAMQCDSCGAAFPKSAKIKACEECGEPRGMATQQRLDFVMSDASGALWDLAGMAWQASAAAWLLEQRQSPWATLIADEPFAGCDASNRAGMTQVMNAMVGRTHFRQVFLVSHSSDTVDAFAHRVEVVQSVDGWRHVEVY